MISCFPRQFNMNSTRRYTQRKRDSSCDVCILIHSQCSHSSVLLFHSFFRRKGPVSLDTRPFSKTVSENLFLPFPNFCTQHFCYISPSTSTALFLIFRFLSSTVSGWDHMLIRGMDSHDSVRPVFSFRICVSSHSQSTNSGFQHRPDFFSASTLLRFGNRRKKSIGKKSCFFRNILKKRRLLGKIRKFSVRSMWIVTHQ